MANTTGKKYGGRQKGTPNKLTKELRTLLKDKLTAKELCPIVFCSLLRDPVLLYD
jgi:hypothetical protein